MTSDPDIRGEYGMQLLDDHIFKLWKEGLVTKEDAISEADSADEQRPGSPGTERQCPMTNPTQTTPRRVRHEQFIMSF